MRISDWSSDVCSSDLLVQLPDARSPTGAPGRHYILPMHSLLAKYPIKNAKWFLPSSNTFAHDTKGRLTGFPYMASVPVLFYNIDAFEKAGLKSESRSEEHTSELQSLMRISYAVFCLKKKKKQ